MPSLRILCSKLHLYVGLALSLVLVAVSLSGSALVFRDEIDRLLRPELHRVTPGSTRASLEEIVARVRAARPDATPVYIEFAGAAEAPLVVWLADERLVHVDPYRGVVLGVSGRAEGAMGWLFVLHTELLAGAAGAWVVGVSGLLLLLLCATGLVLWWPGLRRLRVGLLVVWRRGWKRANYDLHRAGGFYGLLFIALTAATGSALYFYAPTGALLHRMAGTDPPTPPPRSVASAGRPSVSPDAALRAAMQALPEAALTFLYLPRAPRAPVTIRLRTPGEWHPNGRSYVYVDRYRGAVLRVDDARAAPWSARLLYALYPLHIGSVGGPVVRVLYVLLGLAPTALMVTGTLIWYNRWRKKKRRAEAPPPPRRAAVPVRPEAVRQAAAD